MFQNKSSGGVGSWLVQPHINPVISCESSASYSEVFPPYRFLQRGELEVLSLPRCFPDAFLFR